MTAPGPVTDGQANPPDKLPGIDAARGWAILLVMAAHAAGLMSELPYPLKKITNFGWYGVQLFFVVSALTLLSSWYRSERPFAAKSSHFFIRRFLRIAPMYYLGAALYFLVRPPQAGFDLDQLLVSLFFVNAWSPAWLPTIDGGWQVVPGGWSISVEFCFYLIFPVLAVFAASFGRAAVFFVLCILLLIAANLAGQIHFEPLFGPHATELFLFFWLPNQLCVFAVGFLVFSVLTQNHGWSTRFSDFMKHRGGFVIVIAVLMLFALSQIGINKTFSSSFPWLPTHLLVSAIFGAIVVAVLVARHPPWLFVNPFMRSLGLVSFSAYVLHWGILDLARTYASPWLSLEGWPAIGVLMFVLLPTIVLSTFFASHVTYRLVEHPFIRLSHRITRRRRVTKRDALLATH